MGTVLEDKIISVIPGIAMTISCKTNGIERDAQAATVPAICQSIYGNQGVKELEEIDEALKSLSSAGRVILSWAADGLEFVEVVTPQPPQQLTIKPIKVDLMALWHKSQADRAARAAAGLQLEDDSTEEDEEPDSNEDNDTSILKLMDV
jgi:hypothetical protein